ncbi:EthD domain-containing protein [Nocardia sp. 348MFTsu5.1]|uniref:EthD domain-containing protein n=1 Tax=Nocardia sp. 348MFTsu5.1 TaxID=1172185 RepID=UPI0003731FA3|nr:EthD domain-containing protein [Nocardia sp. 348MFTsu5.1]
MPIKMLIMAKRRPDLTPEQFREGYEQSHSRIAVNLFGHLWTSYSRNYLVEGLRFKAVGAGWTGGPADLHYDVISEYIFRDAEAVEELGRIALDHIEMIKEDEALWFDQENSWSVTCETVDEDLTAPKPPLRRWADVTASD